MTDALSLSEEAWHDFCRVNIPSLYEYEFCGGSHEVRFEYDKIERYLNFWDTHGVSHDYYLHVSGPVRQARRLRNASNHFEGQYLDAEQIDAHLQQAQVLAVAVLDLPKATRARELRDILVNEAQCALDRIENMGYLSILPTPHDWEVYQKRFFQERLAFEDPYRTPSGHVFSPVVVLAIDSYRWQRDFA
ncbi:hypothetical protein PG990_013135 [Apiospora arundinis]